MQQPDAEGLSFMIDFFVANIFNCFESLPIFRRTLLKVLLLSQMMTSSPTFRLSTKFSSTSAWAFTKERPLLIPQLHLILELTLLLAQLNLEKMFSSKLSRILPIQLLLHHLCKFLLEKLNHIIFFILNVHSYN